MPPESPVAQPSFYLQVIFYKWWLGRHRQGPLEYFWHKWTWIGSKR